MPNTPKNLIEQLSEDLREGFVQVVYLELVSGRWKITEFADFVGNCDFFGIEGVSVPRLVVRHYEGNLLSNISVDLAHIRMIEVRRNMNEGDTSKPHAWWCAPFGQDLERFAVL